MALKNLCMQNMVEMIKNLPPSLQEEVIGHSLKSIEEDADKKAKKSLIKQIKRDADIVIEDVTNRIIKSCKNGSTWSRPEYTNDIDDDLYDTFVNISEQFVEKYHEKLIFPRLRYYGISYQSEESEYDESE